MIVRPCGTAWKLNLLGNERASEHRLCKIVWRQEEPAMNLEPDHSHGLAFYLGLNAALVTIIVSAISWLWPLQ
jgi:hypothetical protein